MVEFSLPWALILVIIPVFIGLFIPRATAKTPNALFVPFYSLLTNKLDEASSSKTQHQGVRQFFFIWCCLVLAIANPRFIGQPLPSPQESHSLLLALDISGSMALDDMQQNGEPATRLSIVKQAAKAFIDERQGDSMGLILFGSQAYLQTPLTFDKNTLIQRIDDATVGLAGKSTSIGDALGLAIKRLKDVPPKGRVIILLTDGANNSGILDPIKAADIAESEGIKIYTIGLGSATDASLESQEFFAMNPELVLDEKTLKTIANKTGGRYFRATDTATLQAIYQTIDRLETIKITSLTQRPQIDYYPYLLVLALLMFAYTSLSLSGVSMPRRAR
jgi:Ca-activated chloride channel family protein